MTGSVSGGSNVGTARSASVGAGTQQSQPLTTTRPDPSRPTAKPQPESPLRNVEAPPHDDQPPGQDHEVQNTLLGARRVVPVLLCVVRDRGGGVVGPAGGVVFGALDSGDLDEGGEACGGDPVVDPPVDRVGFARAGRVKIAVGHAASSGLLNLRPALVPARAAAFSVPGCRVG